ncbi:MULTISPECIES: hypothetical protein [unclassified Streptomyces]|nr:MULTISPECIES: hypothetical protein [unclassified Streptomyces]
MAVPPNALKKWEKARDQLTDETAHARALSRTIAPERLAAGLDAR